MYHRIIGALLLTACGGGIGAYLAAMYRQRTELLLRVSELLLQMSLMLDFESPTVDEMIRRLNDPIGDTPCFLRGQFTRNGVISALKDNYDGFERCDLARLTALFRELGAADKPSEQQRLAAARVYFERRTREVQPENEKRSKLASALGLLGGLLTAVMIL